MTDYKTERASLGDKQPPSKELKRTFQCTKLIRRLLNERSTNISSDYSTTQNLRFDAENTFVAEVTLENDVARKVDRRADAIAFTSLYSKTVLMHGYREIG